MKSGVIKSKSNNILREVRLKEYHHRHTLSKADEDEKNQKILSNRLSSLFSPNNSGIIDHVQFSHSHIKTISHSHVHMENENDNDENDEEEEKMKIDEGYYISKKYIGNGNEGGRCERIFFTPNLLCLCCSVLIKNFLLFADEIYENKLPDNVIKKIESKLDINLPLQKTIPLVNNEMYWEKCCKYRWSGGEINMIRKDKKKLECWKKIYLEGNLEEYLQSIQSDESITRELYILQQHTLSDSISDSSGLIKEYKDKNEQIKMEDEAAKIKKMMKSGRIDADIKDCEKFSEQLKSIPKFENLHSHKISPSLTYYLLHEKGCKDVKENYKDIPIDLFTRKMKSLFDGLEIQSNSRLQKITHNDDIFSFYDNAIMKSQIVDKKETENNKTLRFWILRDGFVKRICENDKGITKLLDYVKKRNLKKLELLCQLGKDYITALNVNSLRSHIDIQILFKELKNLNSLKLSYDVVNSGMSFDFSMLGMKKKDCIALSKSIASEKGCPNLVSLSLPNNLIDDSFVEILVAGLIKNKKLSSLDMSNNKITEDGAVLLAGYLMKNSSMEHFNLSNNKIKCKGAIYISSAAVCNTSLKSINLSFNSIADEGGVTMIKNLSKLSLKSINISNNKLSKVSGYELSIALIEKLNFKNCNYLNVSGNNFDEDLGEKLLKSLKHNHNIVNFVVRNCKIGEKNLQEIKEIVDERMESVCMLT